MASSRAAPKRILVTGGSNGIGKALCRVLARDHGCHVYLTARDESRGRAAAEEIGLGQAVEVLQLDTTDDESVRRCAAGLKGKGVTLYAIVNNAGVGLNNIQHLQLSADEKTQLVLVSTFVRAPSTRPRIGGWRWTAARSHVHNLMARSSAVSPAHRPRRIPTFSDRSVSRKQWWSWLTPSMAAL